MPVAPDPPPPTYVAVGRIGRAHGVQGEVGVELRTDDPDRRFAVGVTLRADPAARGPLTIQGVRTHHGRLLVRFEGVADRLAAEQLRGTYLVIDQDDAGDAGVDAWWDHQLIGLAAVTAGGVCLGVVSDVIHAAAQDLLSVRCADGREVLVPFVSALVPSVDVAGGRLVVDPPAGLFDT